MAIAGTAGPIEFAGRVPDYDRFSQLDGRLSLQADRWRWHIGWLTGPVQFCRL